ncbi:MAG: heavy-metal-associated domain-containing protein [Cytophagaceae bacterium]|nr:heavy-metal-associated domain-containing protein [Cytophagaceae bacterium]
MNNAKFRSFALIICLTFFSGAFAAIAVHEKTATFKVYGNCAMCIERIQDAALKDKHVKSAEWNLDTKILTVVYDEEGISLQKINENIAAVGHDTETVDAPDRKYRRLPDCCKYDRPRK